jgi:hypothetical protein
MKISGITLLLCASMLFAFPAAQGHNASAEEKSGAEITANLKEMPLLTGDTWQKMSLDEKVAFVWGMGHVATMEREAVELYPNLKRESFAAKLCTGIAGLPMNRIVGDVDSYYRENPGKSTDPVLKVIWDIYVIPKMKTEATDLPAK